MGYSKIKSITVENFMGFKEGRVTFDDSGIINIKGYNSSGKSAFLTAPAVAMMNLYPQKQAKFIHHDMDYFRVIISFDDGKTLVRVKYKTGQNLYEMYDGDKLVYTTKAGGKLTKVDDVPETIKRYLGLIETELGYLNYQVRRDPLWLIDTKGSENYLTLNEVLKSEQIARAIALINSDRNKLGSDITVLESEINTCRMQLDNFSRIDEGLLSRLSDRELFVHELMRKYDMLWDVYSLCEGLSKMADIPEVGKVEVSRLRAVEGLKGISDDVSNAGYFESEIAKIQTARYERVSGLSELVVEIDHGDKESWKEELSKVDISMYPKIGEILAIAKQLDSVLSSIGNLDGEFKKAEARRDEIVKKAEAEGIKFVVCDNCGTFLEVEKD